MGMNSCNLRLLAKEARIAVKRDRYYVKGHSKVLEKELIKYLLDRNIAILECDNEQADSGKSYLINEGIEMLIHTKERQVSWIELRVCLSWIHTALKECYEFACVVNEIIPLWYWTNNYCGKELIDEKQFVEHYMALLEDKYEIFKKSYFASDNVRLTEGELYEYIRKQGRRFFKFQRNIQNYEKIQMCSENVGKARKS